MDRNLTRSQTINAWKMIYRLMDNVKVKMDDDYQARGGNVTNSDVDDVIDYIHNALSGIIRNTTGRK